MKLQRESELKKMIDKIGKSSIGNHIINNKKVLITKISPNYIETVHKKDKNFIIEKYRSSEFNKLLKPIHSKIIDTFHPMYFNIKNTYQDAQL